MAFGFASLLVGVILGVAGVTGSSIDSVIRGKPDKSKAGGPSTGSSTAATVASSNPNAGTATSSTSLPAPALTKLRAIAGQKGWSVTDWLGVIALESGGNPAATNKETGAYGIGQLNPENAADPLSPRAGSTASEYPKFAGNAVEQVEAMAEYIEKSYGTPTNALAHEHANHWY